MLAGLARKSGEGVPGGRPCGCFVNAKQFCFKRNLASIVLHFNRYLEKATNYSEAQASEITNSYFSFSLRHKKLLDSHLSKVR